MGSQKLILAFIPLILLALPYLNAKSIKSFFLPNHSDRSKVDQMNTIEVNGQKHAVVIRGANPSLPLLIYLHGGPGMSDVPFLHLTDPILEQHFLVVHYDQRSAGMSNKWYKGEPLTIEQHIDDAAELTKILLSRYNQEKAYLLGGSWGSVLALLTAKNYPRLYHAVVVRGLLVDGKRNEEFSRQYVVEKLAEQGVTDFSAIPVPPYDDRVMELRTQREWLYMLGGMEYACARKKCYRFELKVKSLLAFVQSKYYSWGDIFRTESAMMETLRQMWPQVQSFSAIEQVPSLDIPVYVLQGRHDKCTVSSLVQEYVDALQAPKKQLIWFEKSAHSPQREEPDLFQQKVIELLLGIHLE